MDAEELMAGMARTSVRGRLKFAQILRVVHRAPSVHPYFLLRFDFHAHAVPCDPSLRLPLCQQAAAMKQLALDIGLASGPTLARFFAGPNEAALQHLRLWAGEGSQPDTRSPVPTYLWGEAGSGKTHLLKAVRQALSDQGASVGWLDASVASAAEFDERWAAVVLDDVHLYSTAQQAIQATLIVGGVNVLMTVLSLWLIDRLGRRPLMLGGLVGMSASLAILGFSFFSTSLAIEAAALGGLIVYVAFFAVSLGPCAWLIISEIFPQGIRGRAMGIAVFANWLCNYIVSLTFLSMLEVLGNGQTFWLYAAICLLGLWFVYKMVPETKGKTLDEIQNFWTK